LNVQDALVGQKLQPSGEETDDVWVAERCHSVYLQEDFALMDPLDRWLAGKDHSFQGVKLVVEEVDDSKN